MQFKRMHMMALVALVGVYAPAMAQNPGGGGTYVGIEAGAYFPTDAVIKSAFGSTLPRIGINFINNRRPEKFKPQINFGIIGANRNGNRFLAVPVTLGIGQQMGNPSSSTQPYWRVGAGAAYLDYSIDPSGTGVGRITNQRVAFTGIAEVGVLLSDRVRLSAAYNYFSKADDFNFTGYEIKVSFLLWKL